MRSASRWVVVALAAGTALLGAPGTAAAAPVEHSDPPRTVGYDVSHPQCDTELPDPGAFAVVGVNGGLPTRTNPCLADQLEWAAGSSGAGTQPEVQLYLNTANPGELLDLVVTWPSSGDTPYGSCDGDNTAACSWQYGWERARTSVVAFFAPAARAALLDSRVRRYTWWLDVETSNTWQWGSDGARARNRAALEGMTSYLTENGGRVGIYSTGQQWAQIVGDVPTGSVLAGRPSWLAGALTRTQAAELCEEPALVPRGRVALVQFVPDDLDLDHSCR